MGLALDVLGRDSRPGVYSIRINIQWRITFTWNDGAENVRIEDYH